MKSTNSNECECVCVAFELVLHQEWTTFFSVVRVWCRVHFTGFFLFVLLLYVHKFKGHLTMLKCICHWIVGLLHALKIVYKLSQMVKFGTFFSDDWGRHLRDTFTGTRAIDGLFVFVLGSIELKWKNEQTNERHVHRKRKLLVNSSSSSTSLFSGVTDILYMRFVISKIAYNLLKCVHIVQYCNWLGENK